MSRQDTAAIEWLRAHAAVLPVTIGCATLRYDVLAAGCIRFWIDDNDGEGWRRVTDAEALAIVEHAWCRELESEHEHVDYSKRGCGIHVVTVYGVGQWQAPTLVEALTKAVEATHGGP